MIAEYALLVKSHVVLASTIASVVGVTGVVSLDVVSLGVLALVSLLIINV